MPFVRIDVMEGRSDAELTALSNAVHRALTECLDVPERDRFQVITEHSRGRFIFDPAYLGVARTEGVVFIQVCLSTGRTAAQKTALYSRLAQLVAEGTGTRPEDVAIILVENTRGDWSFGNGIAQYLTLPEEEWK